MNTASGASGEQYLYQHLTQVDGFDVPQAAGILANAEVESDFDTTAYNGREGALGWFQWEGSRKAALDAYAAAHGLADTDPAAQAGYLDTELSGPYAAVVRAIRGSNDPATVARLWDVGPGGVDSGTGFENSSGSTTTQRMVNARTIYAQLTSGQPLTGGSGAAGLNQFPLPGPIYPGNDPSSTGLDPNPLDWPGNLLKNASSGIGSIAGGVAGSILKVALPFMTKATFVVAGLAVVVVGLYRTSKPAREHIEQALPGVATAAAEA